MAKKRTMTDVEVGLARAMIAKGMKNDQVHFYFNRVDRLISSGRIAQIKEGSYAKDVAAASNDELTAFITKWDADHAAIYPKGPQSPTDVEYIDALFEKRKSTWHVRSGETDVVECKLNYAVNGKIIRTIAFSRTTRVVTSYSRKVKKLKRQRTQSLIHGPDSGSADRPAHSWGDQWRRHSETVGARGPLWTGRTSLPTLPGRWIKSCWRGTNIWPRKTAS
jgi:hypothetical protein